MGCGERRSGPRPHGRTPDGLTGPGRDLFLRGLSVSFATARRHHPETRGRPGPFNASYPRAPGVDGGPH